MGQTLEIIEISYFLVAIILCIVLICQVKSKNAMHYVLAHLVLSTVLFTLQIPSLVLKILLNQAYYGITIFLFFAWALDVIHTFFIMLKEVRKESNFIKNTIKITHDIEIWAQKNSKETSNDQ